MSKLKNKSKNEVLLNKVSLIGTILENLKAPLVVVDNKLAIIYANTNFLDLFKVKQKAVVGSYLTQATERFLDSDDLDPILKNVWEKDREISDYMITGNFPGIGRAILLLNARRLRERGKLTNFMLVTFEGLSALKTKGADMEKIYQAGLKLLTSQDLEVIYKVLINESVKLANAKYGSIFILKKDRLRRVSATHEILKRHTPRKRGFTWTVFKTGIPYIKKHAEIEKVHPDFGELSVGSDITVPLNYGDTTIGVLSVMSERGKLLSYDDLNTIKLLAPIATLAIKHAQLNERLNNALEDRDLFISVTSHELKSPLTAIYAYTQLIFRSLDKGRNPKKSEITKLIDQEERMLRVLNELLEVTRISTGKVSFHKDKEDLIIIIKKAIAEFVQNFPLHKLVFKNKVNDNKSVIYADGDKILQALINVLNNAGKFSLKDTKVTITLAEGRKGYKIKVSDQGKGIPAQQLPFVFEKYYRGTEERVKGMGIGLFLVRNIIERHGGRVSISSEINKGTTVTLVIPKLQK